MKASVIFSTYNSEEWLEKVIWGFSVQTTKDFEIIIADDGSREATKNLIEKYKTELDIPIIHVWQEDNGFQKYKETCFLHYSQHSQQTNYLLIH